MISPMLTKSMRLAVFAAILLCFSTAFAADWAELGPDGGDVRSLALDPKNPDHILLGTASGQIYGSLNGGRSWSRLAQFGASDDYVLDNIAFDHVDSSVIYAAVWSVERQKDAGDLFVSRDSGNTWQPIPAMHGKSIRALEISASDPKVLVIGALDGVFRSKDSGRTWEKISPENHAHIKDIESLAIDPTNPDIVYAGTWHLAWKTADGGKTWQWIKQGVIDDSDVFSLIIDHSNPKTVFLSACSGIYKSENAGELFRKIQGIPSSARRTRVLQQDPVNANVIYAGTTEGLYKSVNAGKTFSRMTGPNIIVNDVLIDPRNPQRVLLATDRAGVLASDNGAQSFVASNRGYSHRQVVAVLVDRRNPDTIYTGVVNDKDFGGVFMTRDAGMSWTQKSRGLKDRDVFTLQQAPNGALFAGTNRGIASLAPGADEWLPSGAVIKERKLPVPKVKKGVKPLPAKVVVEKSELAARVSELDFGKTAWFAATSAGVYVSRDQGATWRGGPIQLDNHFVSVSAADDTVLAATSLNAYMSGDGGANWKQVSVPSFVTRIYSATVGPEQSLWLSTHQGALRSIDHGATWEHVTGGLAWKHVLNVTWDQENGRLLATSRVGKGVYESFDGGKTWRYTDESSLLVRSVLGYRGGLLAATAYNGLVKKPASSAGSAPAAGGGGTAK